ncbi:hypothetical protein QZH41_006718 [Actinostola sp. cb2023]|nr:hypothetical protein QZH41_006718 [Actinostola sp. cb2023]
MRFSVVVVVVVRSKNDEMIRGLVTSGAQHKTITFPRRDDPSKTSWSRNVLHYKVQVINIYKGEKRVRQTIKDHPGDLSFPIEVTISTDDNECAAKLESGMEYVLGGYIDDNELEIFSCNWIETWKSLGTSERRGITKLYGSNCGCRTSLCSWIDPLGGMMDYYCAMDHMYCAMRKDKATFIRGKILSGPVEVLPDNLIPSGIPRKFLAHQVYTIRITKIYKGSTAIRETGGLRVYGSRGRSYTIKIYTPSKMNSCRVDLTIGKVAKMGLKSSVHRVTYFGRQHWHQFLSKNIRKITAHSVVKS